ncbi:MAG: hypothetical protein ACK58Q_00120 [Chitinophagales bacterium]|jgi:hypothetical protein
MESTNEQLNLTENGNKSKPLLCEDFEIYGDLYKIPLEKVEGAKRLVQLMPGWMGVYIEEFKSEFSEYLVI